MSRADEALTAHERAARALGRLVGRELSLTATTHLRDDLGLDSQSLVELTVLVHTMYGIDLGRKAAEKKMIPLTVGDLAELLGEP